MSEQKFSHLHPALAKLVSRAWLDSTFRDQLVNNPPTVLREAGIVLAGAVIVTIAGQGNAAAAPLQEKGENGGEALYEIVLPPKPNEVTDEVLPSSPIISDRICC